MHQVLFGAPGCDPPHAHTAPHPTRTRPLPPPPQAVYVVLREAEHRSTAPLPYWNLPGANQLIPRQKRCQEALLVVNNTLDGLIAKCKQLVGGGSWGLVEKCKQLVSGEELGLELGAWLRSASSWYCGRGVKGIRLWRAGSCSWWGLGIVARRGRYLQLTPTLTSICCCIDKLHSNLCALMTAWALISVP